MTRAAVAAVLAMVAIVGCAPAAPPRTDGTATADVPPALDFSADLVAGGQLSGTDLAGGDVVLWFWAPW